MLWDELGRLTAGDQWTVKTVHERLDQSNSPWRDYEASRAALGPAMKLLGFTG